MWAEIMPVRLLSIEGIRKRKRRNDEGLGCSGLNKMNGVRAFIPFKNCTIYMDPGDGTVAS